MPSPVLPSPVQGGSGELCGICETTLLAVLVAWSGVSIDLLLLSGIQKLVLAGRVGEAIEATQQLYPGLLEHNPNLLFMLK